MWLLVGVFSENSVRKLRTARSAISVDFGSLVQVGRGIVVGALTPRVLRVTLNRLQVDVASAKRKQAV
jgi:hypothetical protein